MPERRSCPTDAAPRHQTRPQARGGRDDTRHGAGAVRASYSATDNGTAKSTQFALGYVYNFSKTVQAYATFASVSNDGGAAASLNGATGIANASSTGFDFGLSKKF